MEFNINCYFLFQVQDGPPSRQNSGADVQGPDLVHEGLAAAFHHLKERNKILEGRTNAEETELRKYLNSPLETVSCLKYWERQEHLAARL